MSYWYISFATMRVFLGATVVRADSAQGALAVATKRNLNPGGEAAIIAIPDADTYHPDMMAMLNKLFTREQMLAEGGKRQGDLSPEEQANFEAAAQRVCADHNPKGIH